MAILILGLLLPNLKWLSSSEISEAVYRGGNFFLAQPK